MKEQAKAAGARGLVASALLVWGVACGAPVSSGSPPAAPAPSSGSAGGTAGAPAGANAAPAASAVAPPASPAAPAERQSVKAGGVVLLSGAPFYVGSDRGYFAEEGIDFEFVPFDSGALAVVPTAAGQLEVAQAPLGPSYYNALARGVALTAIAATTYTDATMLVRKDWMDSGQITKLTDLRGKRVSLNIEGSALDYALRRAFLHEGVRLEELELQRLANSDLGAALANGAVDAGAVSDPLPLERAGLAVRLVKSKDVIGPNIAAVMAAGPSMLGKGEDTIVRFLKGYLKGMRDYQASLQDGRVTDPAVIEILSRWTHIAPDIVAQTTMAEQVPNGTMDMDDLNTNQAYWVSEGLVQTPVDLSQYVDTRYAAAARAGLR